MNFKKIIYLLLGFISLAIGAMAAIIPLLPSFPFLLMALISFGKSSDELKNWFLETKIYKNNLESFVNGQGMTKKAKVKTMVTVTLVMLFGFIMMKKYMLGRIVLGIVWVFHILYFSFKVKTAEE